MNAAERRSAESGAGPLVAGERASARLLRYLDYECARWQVERPSTPQIAAVLHALADHTAIMASLDYRPDADSPWPHATSLGRWFHDTADQMTTTPPGSGDADARTTEGTGGETA